jgi:tungstate transport system substrate-binding protein
MESGDEAIQKKRRNHYMKRIIILIATALLLIFPGCNGNTAGTDYDSIESTELMIATTTSTNDTGLLDVLVPAFDEKYGTHTKWVSVGSGAAMTMGEAGDADVLLVHSRKAEDAFMDNGYGSIRKDVMYNSFLIVGPDSDPANVAGANSASAAFTAIANNASEFLSRGDNSGTHARELEIWKLTGLSPGEADNWYMETGAGMMDLLVMANEFRGYTITDSATWAKALNQNNVPDLKVLFDGDTALLNNYGVIVVNPEVFPHLNSLAAEAFADFITSDEGQKIIGDYRLFGEQLFAPDAK